MQLNIEYMAQLRYEAGHSKEFIEVPEEITLKEVIIHLAQLHGSQLSEMLIEANQPAPTLLCFVNGEQQGFDIILKDGQKVTLMSPISGG